MSYPNLWGYPWDTTHKILQVLRWWRLLRAVFPRQGPRFGNPWWGQWGRAHDTEIPGVLIFKLVDVFPHNYEGAKRIWKIQRCMIMYMYVYNISIFIHIDMYTFVHCMYTHIYLVYNYCVFACYMPEIWPSCRMLWQERWESMHTCSSFLYILY